MAVEDALGKSLEAVLRDELTGPRHLADTTYEPTDDQTNRLTRACAGHLPWLVRRRHEVPDHRLGDALRATGGLFSSAADCAALFASYWPLVDAQLREREIASSPDEAVFGLLRVHVLPSGRRVLYRAGMIYGGASFVGFDPGTRTVVVILRNVTSWPDKRGFAVMEALRAHQPQNHPPRPRASARPPGPTFGCRTPRARGGPPRTSAPTTVPPRRGASERSHPRRPRRW